MKSSAKAFPLVLLAFVLIAIPAFSAHAADQSAKPASPWTIDDVLNQERASSFAISPDGTKAVWIKGTPDKEKDGIISHLYLSGLGETAETLQLTRGENSEFSPLWSPSGKLIAFLSGRKEGKEETTGAQVWLLNLQGGEPWKATAFPQGVSGYDWIDENTLLILAREPLSLRELNLKDKKDTTQIVEDQDHMTPMRLFLYDLKAKKAARITENTDQISRFVLSHDRKRVLTENQQSVRYGVDKKIKPKIFLVDIATKTATEILKEPVLKPGFMAWAMDDKGFFFSVTRTTDVENGGPGAEFLYHYDLGLNKAIEVPLDWAWGLGGRDFVVRNDGFVVSLANGARLKWRRYVRTEAGYTHKDIEGIHIPNVFGLVLQEKGGIALYPYSTASIPGQWQLGTLEGPILKTKRAVTEINAHLTAKIKARTEVIKWKGALNEDIEGILYYPHDYKEGRRYPLFLNIHGGPTGVDMDDFSESWGAYPNILAQKGCFVLLPNYHGSVGYGQKFTESIKGRYYELEIPDILKGIDALIAKGLVDPDRLGTMGWSNGGILTIGLSVWTNRFKVAGVGAADANWISDYGNCAFGVSFDNYYFTGAPWDKLEHYIKKSPLFHLKDMKVPTIIFHGDQDTNVPYGQAWEYYRAIQQIGKAPVRFLSFPGEPHALQKLSHQRRKMEEELAWFDRYFFKTEIAKNDALKEGSPLDIALKAARFARSGALLGQTVKGKLVPEFVVSGPIEVGRFEVTRAQWAAFDPDYKIEPGTENFPATGMTFEAAQKYAEWLKAFTGEPVRFPSAQEAEGLAGKATGAGNTLEFWAGYAPNKDDAALLSAKIRELGGFAPLLLPVDRFLPAGEELIYGLNGNAAEWALDDKGMGRPIGASAVTRNVPNEPYVAPPLEYVGLRMVKSTPK